MSRNPDDYTGTHLHAEENQDRLSSLFEFCIIVCSSDMAKGAQSSHCNDQNPTGPSTFLSITVCKRAALTYMLVRLSVLLTSRRGNIAVIKHEMPHKRALAPSRRRTSFDQYTTGHTTPIKTKPILQMKRWVYPNYEIISD